MASNNRDDEVWGEVIEALPALKFRVELQDGKTVLAYLGGKLHKNFIRVLVGDKVKVYCPPQSAVCRITYRPT